MYEGKEISITSVQLFLINLDRDIIGESTSVKFEVVSKGIKVLVPKEIGRKKIREISYKKV
ncbi:hypothetical protein QBE52_19210 [Clostridiaceae bacterium 35-E11]